MNDTGLRWCYGVCTVRGRAMKRGGFVKPRKPGSLKPYTTGEIADELGVDLNTAIRLLESGKIPFHWSDGHGRRLVLVKDWNAYRRSNTG